MVPFEGPHKKKAEGARGKSAPLATAVATKRATRSKPEKTRSPAAIPPTLPEPHISTVVSVEQPPSEHQIRLSAYFKWMLAGSPEGDGIDFWLEAERELKQTPV